MTMLLLSSSLLAAEVVASNEPEEITAATMVFNEWLKYYQELDYSHQWQLTHPRIRRWYNRERWTDLLRKHRRKVGSLLAIESMKVALGESGELPCTEMGHCYRKGIKVVVMTFNARYEKTGAAKVESVYMAMSDEGWRFGGGTFPNLFAGETIVILDQADEKRYKPRFEGMAQ